jgi:hypothetical protein
MGGDPTHTELLTSLEVATDAESSSNYFRYRRSDVGRASDIVKKQLGLWKAW